MAGIKPITASSNVGVRHFLVKCLTLLHRPAIEILGQSRHEKSGDRGRAEVNDASRCLFDSHGYFYCQSADNHGIR
jgi:hypothetical protein